ncbi:MAG: thioredoxin family protein [Thermodesulfobacteriota bacterium]
MMKTLLPAFLMLMLLVAICGGAAGMAAADEIVPGLPVQGTVTMVDLGAKTCVPCKMMAPILEELKAEYQGRAAVVFIDVWDQANAGKAKAFKVTTIPTQIFFDRHGKEAFRHVGFFDKASIAAKLEALLAQP